MDSRLKLQALFEEILGSRNVYFQPPASIEMSYPAIRYSRSNIDNKFAHNSVYVQSNIYEIVVMDYDPDSEIVERVSKLPTCRFNRHYTADDLNHDVFTLHF